MNQEIKALRSELALLKLQFSEKVNDVEARLNKLIESDALQKNRQAQFFTDVEDGYSELSQTHSEIQTQSQTQTPKSEALLSVSADEFTAVQKLAGELQTSSKQAENNRADRSQTETFESSITTKSEPSFFMVFFQAALSSIFDWFSPITAIYQSYKERDMLGIFILTMVGITLTVAGFGYLMQLLIDQLGAGSKSLLMCFAAVLVMGIGITLKIKTRFTEFATAIVTLGILLSYCTIYFSGSVYGIIPNIAVLFLYLLVALACHALALWLDTKIVAGLGVIGIATMPVLSNTLQIEPLYYLLSLAFVIASSLILAYRNNEPWLAKLSLAFCVFALEWTIGVESVVVSAWIVDLFYLLFFSYIAMTLYKEKEPAQKSLLLLAALVGATVLLFFQSSELFLVSMSLSFTLNAIIAAAVSILFYYVRHKLTHFLILLASLWAVLAIVSAISDAYWGIAWAVEGLLLMYIGRKYVMTHVVNQGQGLTALALVYSWSALALYFPIPALTSVDGQVMSFVIVAVLGIWQKLIDHKDVFDEFTLQRIKPFLPLLEIVWLTILLVASLDIWLGNWTGGVVILLQLGWLLRAKQCKQMSIEIFAAALILVPVYYVNVGALIVDSYRFTTLPLFAKISVISVFCQFWLWSEFYRKYQPDSALKHIAESTRILFYLLIPICWLGSAVRRLDESALMIVWLSPLLALFLANKIKHHLLEKETKLLTVLASFGLMLVVGELSFVNSIIALTGFMAFYGAAFYFNKKTSASDLSQFICSWGVSSLGVSIPIVIGVQSENLLIGLITASLFWVAYLATLNFSEHLKRNETFITFTNGALIVAAWVLTAFDSLYVIIPIIFLLGVISQKHDLMNNTKVGKALGVNCDLFIHAIVAITYVTLLNSLADYRLNLFIAPALAVHGALILFMKDRRIFTVKCSFGLILLGIIKLALIDAANAQLWQKVMLFMGIGVFILIASFWYQKLVKPSVQNHA